MTETTIRALLQEVAAAEIAGLRGSVGGDVLHQEILALLPRVTEAFSFVSRCRVTGASLSLVAGHAPMVRVRLHVRGKTRTVNPSSWLTDILNAFGLPLGQASSVMKPGFPDRLAAKVRKALPPQVVAGVEAGIQNAKSEALVDQEKIGHIQDKLAKKREAERQRQLKIVAQTFRNVPRGLLTEEEVIRMWRENLCREVLED